MRVDNVTARLGVLTLAGPHSRALLAAVTDADCGPEAFPFFRCREIEVGMAPVRAMRVSFVGELGYELHHPLEYQRHIYEQLLEAGEPLGLVDFGYRALDSMRLEKAYRMWGSDLSVRLHAARGRHASAGCAFDKGVHRPRAVAARGRARRAARAAWSAWSSTPTAPTRTASSRYATASEIVGYVTSGGYGFRVERSIALAYLPRDYCEPGTGADGRDPR